ncbi:MAG: sulfatase-like hydrolase/transferase, partial [Candidatus Peregrinibacteria bacterium]|nr:sulfatase-like hydrolase/transferase [Candidatus Peregrinibacteria bacterium]
SFVVQNYANPDVVGHSGSFEAVTTAIKTLDKCMENLIPKLLEHNYDIIMTADHGNADCMIRADGKPNSSHTKSDVPCVLISKNLNGRKLKETGGLADLAPTVLDILDIEKPTEMTGESLII